MLIFVRETNVSSLAPLRGYAACVHMETQQVKSLFKTTIMTSLAFAFATGALAAGHPAWDYGSGTNGPGGWGHLSPDYAQCDAGKQQSPIDIAQVRLADLAPLQFAYKAGPLHITNNGHAAQIEAPAGSHLTIGSDSYDLVHIHFHTPSEEAVNGGRFAADAHFVHRNAAGDLAVVAILFEQGEDNQALAPLLSAIPQKAGKTKLQQDQIFDPSSLLPAEHSYVTYSGSLTTPPCSQNVRWIVLRKRMPISAAQVHQYEALFGQNARPLQPLNDRPVEASN